MTEQQILEQSNAVTKPSSKIGCWICELENPEQLPVGDFSIVPDFKTGERVVFNAEGKRIGKLVGRFIDELST